MANSIGGRIWSLDTAATLSSGPVCVGKMHWRPAAAANTLLVKDSSGSVIWAATALAAGGAGGDEFWENPNPLYPYQGFVLTTIDGGTLYVDIV